MEAEANLEAEAAAPEAVAEPDVFISYARVDRDAIVRLATGLQDAGWRAWVDADAIPATSEWSDEIAAGIRTSHTFIFAVSPSSVRSAACGHELDEAIELGKRLVPVVLEETDGVPDALAARQYVYFREGDDFDTSLQTLTEALATDLDWVRGHRQWLNAALRWEASGRDKSLLVRGRDLKSAEDWLARQGARVEPTPTPLQVEFLLASRTWQTRRLQIVVASVVVALAVSVLLGVVALFQRNTARREAHIALSRELAIAANSQLNVDPELSLLLGLEAMGARHTAEADNALRRAVAARRPVAEAQLGGQRVNALVTDVAFSPAGNALAVARADGTVRIVTFDGRSGNVVALRRPAASADNVCTTFSQAQGKSKLAFSPDGREVAAAGDRSVIWIWRMRARDAAPRTSPFCVGKAVQPSSVEFLNAALGERPVGTVALSLTGDGAVSAVEDDGHLIRWGWQSAARPSKTRLGGGRVTAAVFAAHGRAVATLDASGVTKHVNGRAVRWVSRPGLTALAADAGLNEVAVADGTSVTVWRGGPRPVAAITSPDSVRSLAVSPNGQLVAAGGGNGAIRVWQVSSRSAPTVLLGARGPVTAVAFSADGRSLAASGDDGVLRIWPSPATSRGGAYSIEAGGRVLVQSASTGHRLAATAAGKTRLLDGVAGPGVPSFDRDGVHAATAVGSSLVLWDLATGSTPQVLPAGRFVLAAAVSPDGRWVASAERDRLRLLRWPARDPVVVAQVPDSAAARQVFYEAAAFSSDDAFLAAGGYLGKTGFVTVWRLALGGRSVVLRSPVPSGVAKLSFSADGSELLAALADGSVWVWNLASGKPVVLRVPGGSVSDAAFDPTGTEVATAGRGTVRLWSLADGGSSVPVPGGVGSVNSVAFVDAGARLAIAGNAGLHVVACPYCGPIDEVLARARQMTTRPLTPAERSFYLHSS